jgi:uncharacterized pyridoxamine 5'-phosphate oxidase family protein
MPEYGVPDNSAGLLAWDWARERLERNPYYWVATVRPDGRPHLMPVWALWVEHRLYFSTGGQSRKARNLKANPQCTVSVQDGDDAVIVEGVAGEVQDRNLLARLSPLYNSKYGMLLDPDLGPVYQVVPATVFGFKGSVREGESSQFGPTATRWKYEE